MTPQERDKQYGDRALSVVEAAGLRQRGLSDDTVVDIIGIIVLLQTQAWHEGHLAGGIEMAEKMATSIERVMKS
jgi:hypothetical protein